MSRQNHEMLSYHAALLQVLLSPSTQQCHPVGLTPIAVLWAEVGPQMWALCPASPF